MKIKTSELSGTALDWAVAKCEGLNPVIKKLSGGGFYAVIWDGGNCLSFTNWSQGGPIIDREDITWSMGMEPEHSQVTRWVAFSYRAGSSKAVFGPTKLIAAMRCYVASKLGEEVEIPDGLSNEE